MTEALVCVVCGAEASRECRICLKLFCASGPKGQHQCMDLCSVKPRRHEGLNIPVKIEV